MPCFCWYRPQKKEKQELKKRCQDVVDYLKHLYEKGDPIECNVEDALKLIKHLYFGKCDENIVK